MVRSVDEIADVLNGWSKKPLFRCDIMSCSYIELATFVPWDKLPSKYQEMLTKSKVTKEKWDSDRVTYDDESLTKDIKEEVDFLIEIIEVEDMPAFWRIPRAMALIWVRNRESDLVVLKNIEDSLLRMRMRGTKVTVKKTRDLIKTLKKIV